MSESEVSAVMHLASVEYTEQQMGTFILYLTLFTISDRKTNQEIHMHTHAYTHIHTYTHTHTEHTV